MPGSQVRDAMVRLVDLEALRRIGTLDQPTGVPRSAVTVPVAPDGRVDDTVLFADASDPAVSWYLPRYRLRVGEGSGQYEITTELVDGRWRMTFGLESFPAPEIEALGASPRALAHDLSVTVSSGADLVREYPVAEFRPGATDVGSRPEVVLLLTLQERDALLRAFTRDEERAVLQVHRAVSVAVPFVPRDQRFRLMAVTQPDDLGTHVILPDLVLADLTAIPIPLQHVEGVVPVPGEPEPDPRTDELRLQRMVLGVGAQELATAVGTEGEHQVRGLVVADAVVRQELTVAQDFAVSEAALGLTFQTPAAPGILRTGGFVGRGTVPVPDQLRRRLEGRGLGRIRIPDDGVFVPFPGDVVVPVPDPLPEPVPEQQFTIARTTLTETVLLRFDVDVHPYLFPSGRPDPGAGGFATLVVPWPAEGASSRNYAYVHDEAAGNVFYYLPDVFLIGQRDQAPYGPELSFTVGRTTEADGGAERAIALMSAHLVPQTSPARLRDAERALATHVTAGTAAPELRPAVHPATCTLELPSGTVTTGAPPDLVQGWWISETFDFDDLRSVYGVLTASGAASALLRGRVDVDVVGQVHQVPVEARLDRLAAPPLSWVEAPRVDAPGTVDVTMRNDGDVAVVVPALPAWVDQGGVPLPATVTGDLPTTLAPGATVTLVVAAQGAPEGADLPDATFDLTGVRTVVEPEKAVVQTLDRRVERLPRVVTVLTTPGGLGTSGDPERDLGFIGIQFDGVSGAVLLDHETLQRDVAVPVPLLDWLLDRGSGGFGYRQTLVHVSGTSTSDAASRTADTALLVLPAPPGP